MGGLSWWHWLIILGAFVLLFGAKKLPDAARGVGRSLRILKSEVSAMSDDDGKTKDANGETSPGRHRPGAGDCHHADGDRCGRRRARGAGRRRSHVRPGSLAVAVALLICC